MLMAILTPRHVSLRYTLATFPLKGWVYSVLNAPLYAKIEIPLDLDRLMDIKMLRASFGTSYPKIALIRMYDGGCFVPSKAPTLAMHDILNAIFQIVSLQLREVCLEMIPSLTIVTAGEFLTANQLSDFGIHDPCL
jgi:hypothetical protein